MTQSAEASSFLYGANSAFIEELYQRYLTSPSTLDPSWRDFFDGLADEAGDVQAELKGASWAPKDARRLEAGRGYTLLEDPAEIHAVAQRAPSALGAISAQQSRQVTLDSIRALMMIRAYRVRGHLHANLDPLGMTRNPNHAELDPKSYGFDDDAMDRPIFINYVLGLESATLREILEVVNRTYCGSIGVEFMHMQGPEEKAWIQQMVESRADRMGFRPADRRAILRALTECEGFERYLHQKYTGTKRFGLEGAEALIPALESLVTRGAELGVREISSACRTAAGSTCWPTSWPSPTRRSLRNSRATRRNRTTCRAPATSSTTSAPRRTGISVATAFTSRSPPIRATWRRSTRS